jgi:hypothetical protein
MAKRIDDWTDPSRGLRLAERTLVFDRKHQRSVLWIKGVIVPPIGTEMELSDPEDEDVEMNVTATLIGVRLAATSSGGVTITLDVDVPEPRPWYVALFEEPN